MSTKICDWSKKTIIDGEEFPKDTLNRQRYANYLSNFLISKVNKSCTIDTNRPRSGYVLNLNAEWGTGKSYFLKRWQQDLLKKHPVIYINSWEQDYSDDPLLTLVCSLISQLREQSGKSENAPIYKVSGKVASLFKSSAPIIAGALFKKLSGIDIEKLYSTSGEGNNTTLEQDNDKSEDYSPVASKLVEHMLNEHEMKAQAISSLKSRVTQWVEVAQIDHDKSYPVFVFIDELDRCRPSYAIEMLEMIKHIFDIPGVAFVVATDTEQLQHSIKALYGEGFNAREYLGRFFDSSYTLPKASTANLIHAHCDISVLYSSNLNDSAIVMCPNFNFWKRDNNEINYAQEIGKLIDSFGFSARKSIQIMNRVLSCIEEIRGEEKNCVNFLYLLFLMCLKEKDSVLYELLLITEMEHVVDYNGKESSLIKHLDRICNWEGRNIAFGAIVSNTDYFCRVSLLEEKATLFNVELKQFIASSHDIFIGSNSILERANNFRRDLYKQDLGPMGTSSSSVGYQIFTLGFINALEKQTSLTHKDYIELIDLGTPLSWLNLS